MRYEKITALISGLSDLLKKNKAAVVKQGQQKLVLTAEQHNLPIEKISKSAIKVIKRLKNAGYEAYLVGGGVRDLLLGKTPKDFDVSTNATPEQVNRLFTNARIIGRRFKIVHILYNYNGVNDIIEVTTFRGGTSQQLQVDHAVHSDKKKYQVQVNPDGMLVRDNSYGKSLKDDASRRDFTINAIYLDIHTGELIDFHGGLYDLTQGVIDIIGDPETRYREDPVRILRAVRFSAKLGFKISKRTLELLKPCAPLLSSVPPARLYDEVNKLFLTGHAAQSFQVLMALKLFQNLFAVSDMVLNSSACIDFLMHAYESTDQRFREGKCNKPHFLYAITLWNEFLWNFYMVRDDLLLSNESIDYDELIRLLSSNTIIDQHQITELPDAIIASLVNMWRLQFLLESKNPEKHINNITQMITFRAAYDLFKLRAHFDPQMEEKVAFWQEYYEKNKREADQRRQRIKEQKKERKSKRNNKHDKANNIDLFESNNDKQERTNKARAWREQMNLTP